jgi:ElaA protein
LRWHERTFGELSIVDLYAIIALRERVFVVEQSCAYLEADGLDHVSSHVWAEPDAPGSRDDIIAYLRVVPAGAKFAEVSLGRIVTAPEVRRTGLGRALVRRGLDAAGPVPVRISAQVYLERFYAGLGFRRASEPYPEDGVPHVEMLRA